MAPQPAAIVCSLVVMVVAAIAFDRYCLNDLARADVLMYFPRSTWTMIICLCTPIGGLTYLALEGSH
ncbi:MAG: hypothetical protein M3Y09_13955 [Actinomycetota bacterium]|nr:hypothetical protein [Actinomycetota bacterium]